MIGYVTLGTNDLPRAAIFYDAIAAEMGVGRMMDFDQFIAWPMAAATRGHRDRAATRAFTPAISAIPTATSSTPFA